MVEKLKRKSHFFALPLFGREKEINRTVLRLKTAADHREILSPRIPFAFSSSFFFLLLRSLHILQSVIKTYKNSRPV